MTKEPSTRMQMWISVIALITAIISLIVAGIPPLTEFLKPRIESQRDRRNLESLLALIPSDVRGTCSVNTTAQFGDALASVECYPKDVVLVHLAMYKNTQLLYQGYHAKRTELGVTNDGGSGCEREATEHGYSFRPGSVQGRFACITRENSAHVVWTNTDHHIYVYAINDDMTELMKWQITFAHELVSR